MSWDQKELSISEINEEVARLVELDKDYEEKKRLYRDADEKYESQREKLLNMLMDAGVSKFHADGLGTISMAIRKQVSVPKDPVEKKKMLAYFESLGPELYNAYVTVNSMTLNSYIKEQMEIDPDFMVPGIGEIKEKPELRLRKG